MSANRSSSISAFLTPAVICYTVVINVTTSSYVDFSGGMLRSIHLTMVITRTRFWYEVCCSCGEGSACRNTFESEVTTRERAFEGRHYTAFSAGSLWRNNNLCSCLEAETRITAAVALAVIALRRAGLVLECFDLYNDVAEEGKSENLLKLLGACQRH
jgi:hypothetical protein